MPATRCISTEVFQSSLIVNGAVPTEIITPTARENAVIDTRVRYPEKKLAGRKTKSHAIE
jgi:hypothetical protein